MNRYKHLSALALLLAWMAAGQAWADQGRGGVSVPTRHEAFSQRPGGPSLGVDLAAAQRARPGYPLAAHWHGERTRRPSRARHSRSHLGLYIGVPLFWAWPPPYPVYRPPYYAYPPLAVPVPAPPPVYIERGYGELAPAPGEGYWHYCYNPAGYYPDVTQCPGGWERVAPIPAR